MSFRLFIDSMKTAGKALWARKMRSFLSILGIVVGMLTVAGLLSIALGVKREVTSSIEDLGSNLVIVLPGKVDDEGSPNFFAQLGASTLTQSDVSAIAEVAPEAQNLSAAMLIAGAVKAGEREVSSVFILAGSPGFEHAFNYRIEEGKSLSHSDEERRARAVVLGSTIAETFFSGEDPLGKSIELRGENFVVSGVFAAIPEGISFGGPDFNSIVMMPLSTGWDITRTEQIFRIAMQASQPDAVVPLQEKVRETLLAQHGGEEDFTVFTQEDILGFAGNILDILTAMLGALSAISLFVGGIGIMNIMLVSVSERTREIGIRKAMGATRAAILLQFLIEAVILTAAGGIAAMVLFMLGIQVVQARTALPISLEPVVVGLALGFSILIGIVFGLVPALRASRKHPIEALRYE